MPAGSASAPSSPPARSWGGWRLPAPTARTASTSRDRDGLTLRLLTAVTAALVIWGSVTIWLVTDDTRRIYGLRSYGRVTAPLALVVLALSAIGPRSRRGQAQTSRDALLVLCAAGCTVVAWIGSFRLYDGSTDDISVYWGRGAGLTCLATVVMLVAAVLSVARRRVSAQLHGSPSPARTLARRAATTTGAVVLVLYTAFAVLYLVD